MARYLRPTAPIHADVLLPADPALAMAIAQAVLAKPLMANHHHGLWGYSGSTPDGLELTVQASGIGGPSAAAVVGELADAGVRRIVRIGSCGALDADLMPGRALVVGEAVGADGVSAALGAARSSADQRLTAVLAAALEAPAATVASTDLAPAAHAAPWRDGGAIAVDRETAAVFAVADRLGLSVAAVLVVAEARASALADDVLERALIGLGPVSAAALAPPAALQTG